MKETQNDLEQAKIWLKQKGFKEAQNKLKRDTGVSLYGISSTEDQVIITELSCETEFVGNTDIFQDLAWNIHKAFSSNKPLLENSDSTIEEAINLSITKTKENIRLKSSRKVSLKANQIVGIYHHKGSVLDIKIPEHCTTGAYCILSLPFDKTTLNGETLMELKSIARKVAMQIVAMSPKYLSIESIDNESHQIEESIIRKKIDESKKTMTDTAKESIVKSSLRSFYSENVLLEQEFAILNHDDDNDQTVKLKVKDFLDIKSKSLDLKGSLLVETFEHFK